MTLPNFLIIGAMKAGTTTLYDDLRQTPGVFMPLEKEPNDLADPDIERPEKLAAYERKFRGAGDAKAIGEASTAYTKRPRFDGCAERAVRILGRDLRVIYMVRDPVRRMVSQYHYELGAGLVTAGLNETLVQEPRFSDYSRYAYQLGPWQAVLPAEQILLVNFESYMANRQPEMARIRHFLGLEGDFDVSDSRKNASAGRAVVRRGGLWDKIISSDLYLYGLKRYLPSGVRDRAKALLLPRAPTVIEALTPSTDATLQGRLSEADLEIYAASMRARAGHEGRA